MSSVVGATMGTTAGVWTPVVGTDLARVDAARVGAILRDFPLPDGEGLVFDAYRSSGGHLRFLVGGRMTGAARRLVAALDRVADHALSPERYARLRIGELLSALDAPEAALELDVLLVRAFVRLGGDLRPPVGERPLRASLTEDLIRARRGPDEMEAVLRSWLPRPSQYARLVVAHRRFRELVERGETAAAVADGPLPVPGRRHDSVPALRRRLVLEGFHDAAGAGEDTLYDASLREAVGHYQYAHLIEATGTIDEETRGLLAVPLAVRRQQIARALQHWRASGVRGEESVLRVNVPQYIAELYVDGRVRETFRVVVGRAGRARRGRSRGARIVNQTPEIASRIDRLVLNPVWRVPKRIQQEELEPLLRKDPTYFDRNGFLARGETLVQLPGPRNALGRIKFLFDNETGIYLHDTPLKRLFGRRRRAFSHGCVRLERPMVLARFLLERESHPAAARIEGLLEGGYETELRLQRPLPIVIEYVTVAVDEKGRALFFPDVYGRDQDPAP